MSPTIAERKTAAEQDITMAQQQVTAWTQKLHAAMGKRALLEEMEPTPTPAEASAAPSSRGIERAQRRRGPMADADAARANGPA